MLDVPIAKRHECKSRHRVFRGSIVLVSIKASRDGDTWINYVTEEGSQPLEAGRAMVNGSDAEGPAQAVYPKIRSAGSIGSRGRKW